MSDKATKEVPAGAAEQPKESTAVADGGAEVREERQEAPASTEEENFEYPAKESDGEGEADSDDERRVQELIEKMTGLRVAPPPQGQQAQAQQQQPVLEEPTIAAVARAIKTGLCKNVIVMSGAGLSVSAGIPDFRSPKTGLYHNLARFRLKHAEDIFDIDFFRKNPKPFFVLAKELYPGLFKPTKGHQFIRLLDKKGVLLRNFTQNIDTLEYMAGIPDEKVVYAHGSFSQSHCIQCKRLYTKEFVKERVFADEIPRCTACNALVKPDIVFFGEDLPARFYEQSELDFPKCDLLIIFGTSLVVYPFAALVDQVGKRVPRLLINRERVQQLRKNNSRNVFWQGDCDNGAQELADLIGWGDELKAMCEEATNSV